MQDHQSSVFRNSYLEYWQLSRPPFLPSQRQKNLFLSSDHKIALEKICFFLSYPGNLILMSGERGSGKSAYSRLIASQMDPQSIDVAYVTIAKDISQPGWLLGHLKQHFFSQLDRPNSVENPSLPAGLNALLQENRHLVIVIDACENVKEKQAWLDLKNIFDSQFMVGVCLSVLLCGHVSILPLLAELDFINAKLLYHWAIPPLTSDLVAAYVEWRFSQASNSSHPFAQSGLATLRDLTGGCLDLINKAAEHCLILAAMRDIKTIDGQLVCEVWEKEIPLLWKLKKNDKPD